MTLKLAWTPPTKPNAMCGYDHVIAETPFGRFLITWKSWKDYPSMTIDETPWGEYGGSASSVEAAQQMAEHEYLVRLASATAALIETETQV